MFVMVGGRGGVLVRGIAAGRSGVVRHSFGLGVGSEFVCHWCM